MSRSTPPSFFLKLFRWFCHPDHFEELQGDLEEAFEENVELHGPSRARLIYKKEILKMIRPSVMKRLTIVPSSVARLPMNYLKTSVRAIKLNPFYISANVIGMAVALSIATIGYFYYHFNDTFNHYYENANQLYKVHSVREADPTLGVSSIAIAPALNAAGFDAIRYHHETIAVKKGDRLFQESTVFADHEYLSSFTMKSVSGKPIKLANDDEIIISEEMALKLFDDVYPVGELVVVVFPNQKEKTFVVRDIFEDPPQNVSFHFPMLTSFQNYLEFYEVDENDWSLYIDGTFVHLTESSAEQAEAQLATYLAQHNEANPDRVISKFRLDDILVWPTFETYLSGSSFWNTLHPASVWGTVSTAIAILLLACFNFINTSIALSGKRLKEIAIRKVMGGTRKSTITQFMVENSVMVIFSVILSVIISYFLIPAYNSLMTQEIVQLDQVAFSQLLKFGFGLILFVAILSGAYPSFYISRFSSLQIFRDKLIISGKNRLMMILLTFQFSLCFYNFASLFINLDNAHYQETLDRGYELSNVINIPLYDAKQLSELENRLTQHTDVTHISGTQDLVGFKFSDANVSIGDLEQDVASLAVGTKYLDLLGIRLVSGSFFTDTYESAKNHVIVNKMLEDELGKDLLNESILLDDEKYTVIGVVEDFNLKPMMFNNRIKPTVLRATSDETAAYASIRATGNIDKVEDEVEAIWYELFPQELYKGFLQERVMRSVRETNTIMVQINLWSSIITILISALGLYTLIALKVQRRSKEFGIRKVLGASRKVIISLLGKDLYWILGIGMIVGLVSAYLVITTVFDIIYAYHVNPAFPHFALSIVGLLAIVIITIGYKVVQTGKLNPVQQLRTE